MYAGSSSNFTFRGFADFASNYASDSGGKLILAGWPMLLTVLFADCIDTDNAFGIM